MRRAIFIMLLVSGWLLFAAELPGQAYPRYTSLSDHLNFAAYDDPENGRYRFDERGIILSDSGYHPVLTTIYGLLCYDEFQRTGDTTYRTKVVRQAEHLLDPDFRTPAFGKKGWGLFYEFAFHDLQPRWYSGMAQGMALSLLLRYKSLFPNDKSLGKRVDGACQRIAYFLLQPVAQGGTMGELEDGQPWIEEYPGSAESPHVLNGCVNAWIGLHEYGEAYPKDARARSVDEAVRKSLISHLDDFTLSDWCRYDLGKRKCSPSYFRYHFYQMGQLYAITGDPAFRDHQALYAGIARKLDIAVDSNLFRDPHAAVAVVAKPSAQGWNLPDWGMEPEFQRLGIQVEGFDFTGLAGLNAFLRDGQPGPSNPAAPDKYTLMVFAEPIHADYFTYSFRPMAAELEFGLYLVGENGILHPLRIRDDRISEGYYHAVIPADVAEKGYRRLVLGIKGDRASSIQQGKIGLYNGQVQLLPEFGTFRTAPISLEAGKRYRIQVPTRNVDDLWVFYRRGRTVPETELEVFARENQVPSTEFQPAEDATYQFLVVYRCRSLLSLVSMLRWEEIDEE
ncbi:MAG: D-glucuronyl C5-epimerase family protein [Bacteroidota bacterium]